MAFGLAWGCDCEKLKDKGGFRMKYPYRFIACSRVYFWFSKVWFHFCCKSLQGRTLFVVSDSAKYWYIGSTNSCWERKHEGAKKRSIWEIKFHLFKSISQSINMKNWNCKFKTIPLALEPNFFFKKTSWPNIIYSPSKNESKANTKTKTKKKQGGNGLCVCEFNST